MTLLSPSRPEAVDERSEPARRGQLSRRAAPRVLASAGLALLIAGLAASNPLVVLIGLGTGTAAALRRWLPIDIAVPAAGLLLLAAAIAAGLLAGFTGQDLLAHAWVLTTLYLALGVGAAFVVGNRRRAVEDKRSVPLWVMVPALIAAMTGVLQSLSVEVAKSWAFSGTDIANHMDLVQALQRQGYVDYSATSYPQGLHMLAALASVPRAPLSDPTALMAYDLKLVTGLSWLALALMLWTGAALTVRIGRDVLPTGWIPETAAVVLGGAALLTNTFLAGFVHMGAIPSLLAVVTIWLVPLAAAAQIRWLERIPLLTLGCCAQTFVLAHLWQALALAPAVAWIAYALPRIGDVRAAIRSRSAWSLALRCVPAVVGCLLCAAVPMLSAQQAGGVAIAATPGNFPGDPWRLLIPAVACVPLMFRHLGRLWARLLAGTALGLIGGWILLLAGTDFDIHAWYPLKAAWFLTIAISPLLALGATAATAKMAGSVSRALGRAGRSAFILRATTVAVALAAAFSFGMPHVLGSGSLTFDSWRPLIGGQGPGPGDGERGNWSTLRYDLAADYGRQLSPAVVVPYHVGVRDPFDALGNHIVSELLSFQTGQPELFDEPASICKAITVVAERRPAVVVTTLPARAAHDNMLRHGCPGRARVVHDPSSDAR